MYFLDLLLLIFVFFFVGYIAFLFICILDLSLLMSGFFFPFFKRHLNFKPGSHFRTSPCTCLLFLFRSTIVLESFNEDLLVAFDFDFDFCTAETLGPKSWGYGILSIYYLRWSIHAWREGYHQDLAWW